MKVSIEPLHGGHATEPFDCGSPPLEQWLRQVARQHTRKGISRTYVAVDPAQPQTVLGYYSLTVGEAQSPDLPAELARRLPRNIPIALLGRLAVATVAQGQGLGGTLLVDALARIVRIAEEVGIAAIIVDAKDERAARFYQRYGFVPFPGNPNRLVLPVGTAKAALE